MTDSLCRKRKLADSFIPCVMVHGNIKHNTGIVKNRIGVVWVIWPFNIIKVCSSLAILHYAFTVKSMDFFYSVWLL